MTEQKKVYCRYCKHCMKVKALSDKIELDKITCRHNPSIVDSFYSPKYQYHYCSKKNKNNDCIFFEDITPILEEFSKEIDKLCYSTNEYIKYVTSAQEIKFVPPDTFKPTIWGRIQKWLFFS